MKRTPMQRISGYGRKHRQALYLVALNDEPTDHNETTVSDQITVMLIGDLWYNGDSLKAARDIIAIRRREVAA